MDKLDTDLESLDHVLSNVTNRFLKNVFILVAIHHFVFGLVCDDIWMCKVDSELTQQPTSDV